MAPRPAPAPPRLKLTPRSAVLAVALLGATLALLRMVAAAERVIGWVVVAAAVAGLLHPLVSLLARRLPRAVAVAVVAVATLAFGGMVAYGAVDDIVRQTDRLQETAPVRAARLEQAGRFAELAREARLEERTRRFVDEVPASLRGGTPAEALRAAATRGVAFLATGVLTLFFLLHGPRLARAGLRQVHDEVRRSTVERIALDAFHRGFGYARGSLLMAAGAGLLAFALARVADVPGAAPLALWVALWDVVPLLGAVVGSLPMIALAAVVSPAKGLVLAGVFLAYQVLEALVLQRSIERRSVRLGPFLSAAGAFAGIELYGIAGGLLTVLGLALVVAVADDWAPE